MNEGSTVATSLLFEYSERQRRRYFRKEGNVQRTLEWKENINWVQDGVLFGNLGGKPRIGQRDSLEP